MSFKLSELKRNIFVVVKFYIVVLLKMENVIESWKLEWFDIVWVWWFMIVI